MARTDREKNYMFNKGVEYARLLVEGGNSVHIATLLRPQEEDDPDIRAGIDAEAFECDGCGHWCDRSEESQLPGFCDDCEES